MPTWFSWLAQTAYFVIILWLLYFFHHEDNIFFLFICYLQYNTILSLHRMFDFDNLLVSFCCSCVWLPVWLDLLCAAWFGLQQKLTRQVFSANSQVWNFWNTLQQAKRYLEWSQQLRWTHCRQNAVKPNVEFLLQGKCTTDILPFTWFSSYLLEQCGFSNLLILALGHPHTHSSCVDWP